MENFSSFKRVVGAKSESQEQAILESRSRVFLNQDFPELERIEKIKTPEETAVISLANKATDEILERYGVAGFTIPDENIHVIPESKWQDEHGSAFYIAINQAIAIREEPALIVYLKKVFHEMLHFKSYASMQLTHAEEAREEQYRVGLTVVSRDGKKQYFKQLNEAVTEELTKQFVTELFQDPIFLEENKRTAEITDRYSDAKTADGSALFDDEVFYANTEDVNSWREAIGRLFGAARRKVIIAEGFTYKEERGFLNALVDRLYQMNFETFKSRQEVFDLFAQAAFTGNLLTIGKLIDRTFGSGTFRKIGEMGNDSEVQREMYQLLEIKQ